MIQFGEINKDINKYINQSDSKTLKKTLELANYKYYNNPVEPMLTDENFDVLEHHLKNKHSFTLNKVGESIDAGKKKVILPVFMPSIKKIKYEKGDLQKWVTLYSNNFIVSDKLDGISLLLYVTDNKIKASTRGDGKNGGDISWIVPYLNIKKIENNMFVRGELIISKKNWTIIQNKNSQYSNPRNFISGYTNKKKIDPLIMKYIDFIVFELQILSKNHFETLSPEYQLNKLKEVGFNVVDHTIFEHNDIQNETIMNYYKKRISKSKYEIDGVVVASNKGHQEKQNTLNFPKHKRAFKMLLKTYQTKVDNINWSPSMYGVLKPVIQINPIRIDNVIVSNVNGYNARYITENKIGKDCILSITRSGGVIPKIISIVKPSKEPLLPNSKNWKWNKTNVDIILNNPLSNHIVQLKRIEHFMNKLNIQYVKKGILQKLIHNGFDSITKLINIKIYELDNKSINGFKKKSINKIVTSIQTGVTKASLVQYMAGSLYFKGFSEKKIQQIVSHIPNIFDMKTTDAVLDISKLHGFTKKSGIQFVQGINPFLKFMKSLNIHVNIFNKKVVQKKKKEFKYIYAYTGFVPKPEMINKANEQHIGFTKNVKQKDITGLIAKKIDSTSNKMEYAKGKNMKIIHLDIFKEYLKL